MIISKHGKLDIESQKTRAPQTYYIQILSSPHTQPSFQWILVHNFMIIFHSFLIVLIAMRFAEVVDGTFIITIITIQVYLNIPDRQSLMRKHICFHVHIFNIKCQTMKMMMMNVHLETYF